MGGFSEGGGLFGNILGPNFLGLSGKTNKSTQETKLDPTTQALNMFRLQQMQGMGVNPSQLYGRPDFAFGLSPQTQGIGNQIQQFGTSPGFDAGQWYNQSWSQLNPSFQQQQATELAGQNRDILGQTLQGQLGYGQGALEGTLQNQLGYGQQALTGTLQDYLGTGNNQLQNALSNQLGYGSNSLANQLQNQLGYINNNIAPGLMGAGNQYYNQIIGPQLGNDYSLMGLGRSGGRQEAEARGAASIALPLQQTLAGMQGGALSQYGQNLAGLNQAAYGQYGQGQQNLLNQAYGQYGQGQQNLVNQAYGAYGSGLQNLIGSAYGQYGQGLQQNLAQDYGTQAGYNTQALQNLYGLNQAYPGAYTGGQAAQMGKLGQAFTTSDYARSLQQQGFQGQQQAYLSALNSTPYTPATTIKGTNVGNEGLLNTAFAGGVGQGMGAAVGSDIRMKKNIEKLNSQAFLDQLKAYTFEYKDPRLDPGRHAGVMAQDLEQTELGQQFVQEYNGVKYITFTPSLFNLMLGCIVDLNERIRELEYARTQ